MRPTVLPDNARNSNGLTLIEMMVALAILLIVLLGLYHAAILSIDSSVRNLLREEALRVASDEMNLYRNTQFALINPGAIPRVTRMRNLRNIVNQRFFVDTTVTAPSTEIKQISIMVTWDWKERTEGGGNPYTFNTISIVRR
jgi:prepilin-type N-terminal cleavage/methylation domain-containing protein